MSKWHSGPPPHIGWWLTTHHFWRWWDGRVWSSGATSNYSSIKALRRSKVKMSPALNIFIHWSDHWPENARVPRIDPRQA